MGPVPRSVLSSLTGALALSVLALGCESGKTPAPSSTAVAQPSPALQPGKRAPTPKQAVHFETADGQQVAGDLYLAANHSAPAVVLVDRRGRGRGEFAPLVQRLVRADKRFTVLAFDLRGAGESPPPLHPPELDPGQPGTQDVRAAIAEVLRASGQRARGVVLVGSSLGAALVSRVAFSEPKVTALALISPGAAIDGVAIYQPYAQVRNLPTFLAACSGDEISKAPLEALSRMAMAGTVKRYPGRYHSAGTIGRAHPELWKDLESWLMGVFDEKPVKRVSLYYARGKEPGARAGRLAGPVHKKRAGGAGR